MSKSKGNVINPDDLVRQFGSDTTRVYLCFMSQYDQGGPWDPQGISGAHRFLVRVYSYFQKPKFKDGKENEEIEKKLHQTIQKVGEDIARFKFNTAIAALMEFLNAMSRVQVTKKTAQTYILLLAPFAPHIAEELWEKVGGTYSVHTQNWPTYKKEIIEEASVELVVQVNGKLRATVSVSKGITKSEAEKRARGEKNVKHHLQGKIVNKIIFVRDKLINFVAS